MAAGLYDITNETLGKGHFAVVKLARHCLTGELVAVKIIDKAKLGNEGLQQLGLEIRLLSRLSEQEHPNIVKLYQVIDTNMKLYLVMEYCGRNVCDLYDYIQKRNSGNGLKETEAKYIFRQICSAIAYCHSLRIVHRDLKPENILIATQLEDNSQQSNGKFPMVKLIDFGFSNQWDEGEKLRTSCGSLAYSAPEILLGDHYDGDKVDIWGLGCILYILLYGSNPFMQINDSETLIRILDCTFSTPPRPSVSESSITLIKSLLKRDPNSRLTIHQILQHHWLRDANGTNNEPTPIKSGELITETPKLSSNISTNQKHQKSSVHESIIDQMINLNVCKSKDEVERALFKTKRLSEKNDNLVNGVKDSTSISHDNYLSATYHLLKDKCLRELRNISSHTNANANTIGHHHKRILPSRPRKQLLQQPSRLRPGFIVEEDSEQQFDSNSSSPQLETPVEDDKFFLPLARKCSIVSEEGSCAGTDHLGSDGGSEKLLEFDRYETGGSYPSVDIVVTDCSIDEDRETDEPSSETRDDSQDLVDCNGDVCRTLNSNLTSMHMISSSPELRDDEYVERETGRRDRSTSGRGSVIIANESREHNDFVEAFSHKGKQSSLPSTSLRVIVQSKSCNNILLNDENKSTNMKSNECRNSDTSNCQKLVKKGKRDKNDCCHIC
ncbi:protein kinase-like protein 6 [Leptotrombidium deliense]|uniref:non-specific serine/threonine protein kinase n=1 Tax=Leptotrombidium deliense TaxID=299467 RepID=A0A443SEF6_9ACAR|nr:protein kinase-like protein 6 [Leptotrombidium deliense]